VPRVLGLTASVVTSKVDINKFVKVSVNLLMALFFFADAEAVFVPITCTIFVQLGFSRELLAKCLVKIVPLLKARVNDIGN
jgi:hypothetical protein